ncbi:hypothetical protein BFW38_00150 [Terasakiispira papahanaumokuakeensis]|uniref:Thiol:disulfide interchange protein n=1 Tax=Terasakiispira papahanaumokuakeensis TaxID=197479 RepID=A0A1E2V5D2_9GAMM|nr:thioredoxin fold domain-containing protein [Terasakiispira papahanaumokuakeensis]ODC02191.1 hypothetical protein BFW38_00150 [Terasakiispira papahanaumokuakeensis]
MRIRLLALLVLLCSGSVWADQVADAISAQVKKIDPRLKVAQVQANEALPGLYDVVLETGERLYATADGQYMLAGSLLKITDRGAIDLTEAARAQTRQEALTAIPDDQVIVYPAQGEERAVLNVFTDISCPYCRKFHEEVPKLNQQGVTVRYLAFPRNGLTAQAAQSMRNVWCAKDKAEALTAAKAGESVETSACDTDRVAEQYELGLKLGVQGTPALMLPDGRMVPGYVPVDRLITSLGLSLRSS